MNCLIIGGAGYVGTELVRACLARDDTVTVLDNFSNGDSSAQARTAKLGVNVIEGTIANEQVVREVIGQQNFDIIYHLAAIHYIPYCIEHPNEVFETNYRGLQNVITCIRELPKAPLFIFASSASVYGSPTETCTEATSLKPNDIYGSSKLAGEHLIEYQLENYVMMRLFNVYGELDPHPHLIPKIVKAATSDQTLELGTATAKRDFVYVKDVANAFYAARNAPKGSTYIIATGKTHSVSEAVDAIYRLSASKGTVIYDTAPNMRAADASNLCGDASRLRSLGWQPSVTFYEGLQTAIDAQRQINQVSLN